MKLTPRLKKVAEMVPSCSIVADIGTDHAYVPIYLIKSEKAENVIACDVHKEPAERAKIHIKQEGVSARIEVRVGFGLSILESNEAEGIIIAGMGGLMIRDILNTDKEIADTVQWFILQPQNHIADLKLWLRDNGYKISEEGLVAEDNRIYEVFYVEHGYMDSFSDLEAEIGVTEERYKDALFGRHLEVLLRKRQKIIDSIDPSMGSKRNMDKYNNAISERKVIKEVLWKYMQKTS